MFNKKNRKSMSEDASASVQAEETLKNGTQELKDEELSDVAGGVNPFYGADRVPLKEYDEQARKKS